MTSGGNNFDDFPEKQLTKFSLNDEEREGKICLLVPERRYGPARLRKEDVLMCTSDPLHSVTVPIAWLGG